MALALAGLLGGYSPSAKAHNPFEVDVAAGYRLPGGVDVEQLDADGNEVGEGRLQADGSVVLSGTLGYRIQPDGFIYLTYSRTQTTFRFEADDTGTDFSNEGTLEYFQFGGNVETTNGIFVPYLGFSVGLGRLASLGGGGSRVFFAPVLDGGLKIDLHEHVHLRFVGRLPVLFARKDIFCSGASCAHSTVLRPLAQLEVLGGVGVSF